MVCAFVNVTKAQTVFNKYFPSGSMSMGSAIERNTDGNYLLSSYFGDSLTGLQGLDLKIISEQGDLLNSKRFLMPSSMPFLSFLNNCFQYPISDRTMLVTAGSYSGNVSTVIYASYDRVTLDTNWIKTYSDSGYNLYLNSITKFQQGSLILFGSIGNDLNFPTRPMYLILDSLGNILKNKKYNNYLNLLPSQAIYDSSTNYIYLAGQDYSNPNFPVGAFVCVDTSGNEIWKKVNYGQFGPSTMVLKNGYLTLAGTFLTEYEFNNSKYKLSLMKLDITNGNMVWQKKYGESFAPNLLNALHVDENGDVLSVGLYKSRAIPYSAATDGVMLKVNTNGDSLWMHTYGNFGTPVNEVFYDIEKCSDGGYMLIGVPHFAQPPNSQIWVVKTDSMGFAPGLTTSFEGVTYTALTEALLYPNPAGNTAYLNLPGNVSSTDLKLRVIDASGKDVTAAITTTETRPGQLKINCQNLPAGIYLLKLLYHSGKTELKRLALSGSE